MLLTSDVVIVVRSLFMRSLGTNMTKTFVSP